MDDIDRKSPTHSIWQWKDGDHLFANLPLLIFALTVALLVGLNRQWSSPRTTLQQLQVAPSVRLRQKVAKYSCVFQGLWTLRASTTLALPSFSSMPSSSSSSSPSSPSPSSHSTNSKWCSRHQARISVLVASPGFTSCQVSYQIVSVKSWTSSTKHGTRSKPDQKRAQRPEDKLADKTPSPSPRQNRFWEGENDKTKFMQLI